MPHLLSPSLQAFIHTCQGPPSIRIIEFPLQHTKLALAVRLCATLPHVHSRTSPSARKERPKGSRLDERTRASESGACGRSALRLCNLVARSEGDAGGGEGIGQSGNGATRDHLHQTLQEPNSGRGT